MAKQSERNDFKGTCIIFLLTRVKRVAFSKGNKRKEKLKMETARCIHEDQAKSGFIS